jgi:predicted AlkP superfamily pyrophosphatase or phosphodiesterase
MSDRGAVIFVLVDALGWEVLRGRPFLDDVLTSRQRVETILGYSSGAIPTLLTGVMPERHGHWNLFFHSPDTSPFRWTRMLARLPRAVRESRPARRAIKEVSRQLSGYSGYFATYNLSVDRLPYFDLCETNDIYSTGALAPERSLFDRLDDAGLGYECFNYHHATDEVILQNLPRRIASSPQRVFFVYLSGLDAYLHRHVRDASGVSSKLHWYERELRRAYKAACARWGAADLYVFSDHGMTPVSGTRDLMQEVEQLGLRVGSDYLPVYDSTMARFWTFDRRSEERLVQFLAERPYGRLVSSPELATLGLGFADDRYGQVVFVMQPGTIICPSDMGRLPFGGMHGFHPQEDPHSYAVFLSNQRPPVMPVRHIADVLDTLLAGAGIAPARAVSGRVAVGAP